MRKYEITDITHKDNPRFKRIRALKDFFCITAGAIGGYIDSEDCLSQEGNCWVGGDALVGAGARITDNAVVTRAAQVGGGALIFGDAFVMDSSFIHGSVSAGGTATVCDNARLYGGNSYALGSYLGLCNNVYVGGDVVLHGGITISAGTIKTQPIIIQLNSQVIIRTDDHISALGAHHTIDEWANILEEYPQLEHLIKSHTTGTNAKLDNIIKTIYYLISIKQ